MGPRQQQPAPPTKGGVYMAPHPQQQQQQAYGAAGAPGWPSAPPTAPGFAAPPAFGAPPPPPGFVSGPGGGFYAPPSQPRGAIAPGFYENDPSAPLLMSAPVGFAGSSYFGGGGGAGPSAAGYGPAGDYGMGTDLMYASRAMRHGFVRKVLGIVSAQLLLTAAIAAPILLYPAPRAWLATNAWAVPLAFIITFLSLIVLACSEGARRSYPSNLLLLGAFTAAEGVLVGVSCAAYQTPTVLMAAVMTAVVCLGLVMYAFQTRYDFTAAGGMLYSALVLLLMVSIGSWVLRLRTLDLLIAGSGALVFSCYVVYDVQLLIAGEHSVSISVDEPVMAALNIYVDIINLFLFILQIMGRDDD